MVNGCSSTQIWHHRFWPMAIWLQFVFRIRLNIISIPGSWFSITFLRENVQAYVKLMAWYLSRMESHSVSQLVKSSLPLIDREMWMKNAFSTVHRCLQGKTIGFHGFCRFSKSPFQSHLFSHMICRAGAPVRHGPRTRSHVSPHDLSIPVTACVLVRCKVTAI